MERFIRAEYKKEAFERFYRHYQEHISEVVLFPGIRELLLRLKNHGAKICIFTGGGRVSTRFCLQKEGILELFDALITGDDVTHPKPDPEGVLKAMDKFGYKPIETLVVGDADADIVAGEKAGAATALAAWGSARNAQALSAQPDYVFTRISDFELFLFDGVHF
jgi:phosphoglycolate phosphatase/pyrophosphatase PpaX